MKGDYPIFKTNYSHDELADSFTLSGTEVKFVYEGFRGEINRYGAAILLKSVQYLGYFPEHPNQVPEAIRSFVGTQMGGLLSLLVDEYASDSRTMDNHKAAIRQFTGLQFPTEKDRNDLENWLSQEAAFSAHTQEDLMEMAVSRLRSLRIELLAEKHLRRVVSSALNTFFQSVHNTIADQLTPETRQRIDEILIMAEDETHSEFHRLKEEPGRAGMKSLKAEISRLQKLRGLGVKDEHPAGMPYTVLKVLYKRAKNERPTEMLAHPEYIRYGLMVSFIHIRRMEIRDDIVRIFLKMIHRISVRAHTELVVQFVKRVGGKMGILDRLSQVALLNATGIIREVIYPVVPEEKLQNLVDESKMWGARRKRKHRMLMVEKYNRHYRQMVGPILENLSFRSSNQFQPVIQALDAIGKNLPSKASFLEEEVPIAGVVTPNWQSLVFDQDNEGKINRKYYELCTLQRLERALKCKEVFVEGSHSYRDPNQDMPQDWGIQSAREQYYQVLNQPQAPRLFVDQVRNQLGHALESLNKSLPDCDHLRIGNEHVPLDETSGQEGSGLPRRHERRDPAGIRNARSTGYSGRC